MNRPIPELSRNQIIAYASPALPLSVIFAPSIIFLPPMYGTEVGLSLGTVGLLFLLARVWDAITDPLIGGLSDRTQSRFGRRKVWIVCAAPFLMLASYGFFQPPDNASMWYLLAMILLFYPIWTMVMIPYQSWGAELSKNYQERTRIVGFREMATMSGTLLVLGTPLFFIDPASASKREVLGVMCSLFLVLFLPAVALAIRKAPDYSKDQSAVAALSWKKMIALLTSNKPFLFVGFAYLIVQIGYGMYLSMIQLFIISHMGLGAHFLTLVFIKHVVSILFVTPWVNFSKKVGKHIGYSLCLLATAIGLIGFSQIEPGNFNQALILFVYMGIATAPILVFPPALVADTIDYNNWRNGREDTGLHMAVLQLTNKTALALSIGLAYPILEWAGFQEGSNNTVQAMEALLTMTSWVPAVILIIAALLIRRFPLNERRHAAIQKRLARKQSENAVL